MFCQLVESSPQRERRSKSTFFISFLIHAAILISMALVPLLYHYSIKPEVLTLLPGPIIPSSAPNLPSPPPKAPVRTGEKLVELDPLVAPESIPQEIPEPGEPLPDFSYGGTIPGEGLPGGISDGIPGGAGELPVPVLPLSAPTPPPPRGRPAKEPIRMSSGIQQSKLIHRVQPLYPGLALRARVQGIVLLQAVIDENGDVQEVTVIRGHPLLVTAATEAVRQWKYTPTLLSGEPVPIVTTVSVIFKLN